MPEPTPPRQAPPGLGDLFSLIGTNNPVSMLTKSVEQFRSGVTSFIEVVQTFKQTMDNLNAMTQRMNRLLDDMEGPVRTVMPQITKSAESAAKMIALLRGPVERVAPGLDQLAELLANPVVVDLPRRMTETMDVVSALPKALGPLGQMAEMAGGLFGGSRGFAGLTVAPRPAAAPTVVTTVADERPPAPRPSPRPAPARRAPARATATSRTARSAQDAFERSATKAGTKGTAATRAAARKATTKKTAAKKAIAKKAPAKKAPAKKAPARRTAPKKKAAGSR